jgi:hypothetical protein
MTHGSHLQAVPDEFDWDGQKGGDGKKRRGVRFDPRYEARDDLPDGFFLAADFKSTDKHGHGETVYTKLPADVKGHVGRLVEDKRTPYRSSGDFYRDCVMRRIREIEAHGITDDDCTEHVQAMLLTGRLQTQRIKAMAQEEMVTEAISNMQKHVESGNMAGLVLAIEDAQMVVDIARCDVTSLEKEIKKAHKNLESK